MSKTRPPYATAFRQQMVELSRPAFGALPIVISD